MRSPAALNSLQFKERITYARSTLHQFIRLQDQNTRAAPGTVLKTQETSLTAEHLQDKTISILLAGKKQATAKAGKAQGKDPCASPPSIPSLICFCAAYLLGRRGMPPSLDGAALLASPWRSQTD